MEWTIVPAIREPSQTLEKTLADIESHMPSGHIYRDSRHVTWAHETTHGLNARIRNQSIQIEDGLIYPTTQMGENNACYVLQDRAIVLPEPSTRLSVIAGLIPSALQGMSYNLYIRQQQRYWDSNPLYILDEWGAYSNGTETALDANGGDGQYSDALQMLEFMGYSFYLLYQCKKINYEQDQKLTDFMAYQAKRTIRLYKSSQSTNMHSDRQEKYMESLTSDSIVEFLDSTYGSGWFKRLTHPEDDLGIL